MGRFGQLSVVVIVIGAAIVIGWFAHAPKASAPTNNSNAAVNQSTPGKIQFSTTDLPDRDPQFDFRLMIPANWAAEEIDTGKVIRMYIPGQSAGIDGSQLVVRLGTSLPIAKNDTRKIDGMLASWFHQQKQPASSGLPNWLQSAHTEAWVAIKGNPSKYYVFAEGPQLNATDFSMVVGSLRFGQSPNQTSPQLN